MFIIMDKNRYWCNISICHCNRGCSVVTVLGFLQLHCQKHNVQIDTANLSLLYDLEKKTLKPKPPQITTDVSRELKKVKLVWLSGY